MATITERIPVDEFNWNVNFTGELHDLLCENHPQLRWMTKHIANRSLHYVGDGPECECPISDLRVIVY